MAATPWKTSSDIIESVKRKIMMPIHQITFTEEDILKFANEEMATSQIPSILDVHEEYLVRTDEVSLEADKVRYPIPDRAIGLRLRDLFYQDSSGNLFEMTRVSVGDIDLYQSSNESLTPKHKYYLENNDVVLLSDVQQTDAEGTLVFKYFIRPNQLVLNNRAAIINGFTESITLVNASIVAGDTVTIEDIVFTAVASSPSTDEFEIGGTAIITATNLALAINTEGSFLATNGTPATDTVTITFDMRDFDVEVSNSTGFEISETTGIQFDSIPDNIENGSIIDFLQTKPGHKIYSFDVEIPDNAISTDIIEFDDDDIPEDLVVGDYICLAHECIIPQIPPDLHNVLCERTAASMLESQGDQAGLQAKALKIQEMEKNQSNLIDNRVEGAPQKIVGRHSLLKLTSRRKGW